MTSRHALQEMGNGPADMALQPSAGLSDVEVGISPSERLGGKEQWRAPKRFELLIF